MGSNTLTNRSSGQTILDSFFNDIHQSINGDFVGRNTSGVPAASQNLGTTALPWGTVNADTLVLGGDPVDISQITSPANRVISGKKRTTSNQPAFITPTGSAASFTIYGSTTNLVLDINGSSVSVSTDIAVTGLTVAPGSNNTCTLNDADAASQDDTRNWGEPQSYKKLTVSSMGTNITALIGKVATFKTGTEYFQAYVESSTVLSKAMRGYFYGSDLVPLNRTVLANSATITLMSTAWIFVENNATTVSVTYTNPVWDYTAPTGPATNDYWYDMGNSVWKRYDGASWAIINRTFVGYAIIDATNCVAARCEDFYFKNDNTNTLDLEVNSTSIIQSSRYGCRVSVHGSMIGYNKFLPKWNITTQLAASADMYNATEQASTLYYLYIKDTGEQIISDIAPYIQEHGNAQYHPHNPWRCVGLAYNDGSSNLITASVRTPSYAVPTSSEIWLQSNNGWGSTNTKIRRYTNTRLQQGADVTYSDSVTLGASFTINTPGLYLVSVGDVTNNYGVSLNTSAPTTTANQNLTYAQGFRGLATAVSGAPGIITVALWLKQGDVVRSHHDGGGTGTTEHALFRVLKVQ